MRESEQKKVVRPKPTFETQMESGAGNWNNPGAWGHSQQPAITWTTNTTGSTAYNAANVLTGAAT